jgi:UDP-glucose 6-dehydrogenase
MSPTDPRYHDYVIIGGPEQARDRVAQYFIERLGPEKHYFLCPAKEAELIKYMENAFFGVKIAFCHQFYDLCNTFDINYNIVREGWLLDNRVGRMHTAVFDSKGFKGKCIPKDLRSIANFARTVGSPLTIVEAALKYNRGVVDAQVEEVPVASADNSTGSNNSST